MSLSCWILKRRLSSHYWYCRFGWCQALDKIGRNIINTFRASIIAGFCAAFSPRHYSSRTISSWKSPSFFLSRKYRACAFPCPVPGAIFPLIPALESRKNDGSRDTACFAARPRRAECAYRHQSPAKEEIVWEGILQEHWESEVHRGTYGWPIWICNSFPSSRMLLSYELWADNVSLSIGMAHAYSIVYARKRKTYPCLLAHVPCSLVPWTS